MELTDSFLVAMMFVMILSIGIASVLGGFGTIVQAPYQDFHWLPIAWMALVLFSHFDLFWHTVLIIAIDDWRFTGFLYMIFGPVLLFLASAVLIAESAKGDSVASLARYFSVSPYFFGLLALLMLWTIGADYALGQGSSISTAQYVIEFAIFSALALCKNLRLHQLATLLTLMVVVTIVLARGFG